MKKILKRTVPVLIIIVSVFIVKTMVAAKPAPEKKPKEQRLLSLYVDEVKSETVQLKVSSYGEVKPQTEIDLRAQVSGQIVSISDYFAEGASFKDNATLIKIDDRDYKVAVVRAKAQVAKAKVNVQEQLANSKIKKEQWKLKSKKATPSDFALNIPQIAEAKASLRAAEADLDAAQLNLDRTVIKAPFKGRVMTENIGIGEYITPGTVLGHIFSTDVVEIRLALTDSQMSELNLPMGFMEENGNAPIVNLSANIGNKLHNWQGRISRTNAAVDRDSRLIYAIAEVVDPYGDGADDLTALAVGLYVSANIESNKLKQSLIVPRNALHNNNKVYVVNDENKLEIRNVSVLSTNDEIVHLTDGVNEGEKVVTSAIHTVTNGMLVKPLTREKNTNLQAKL